MKDKHPFAWMIGSFIGKTVALVFMSTMMTMIGMYVLALIGML